MGCECAGRGVSVGEGVNISLYQTTLCAVHTLPRGQFIIIPTLTLRKPKLREIGKWDEALQVVNH